MSRRSEADLANDYMSHILQVKRLPIIDTHDPKAVADRINEYFELCNENKEPPTMTTLALSLGVTRGTLYRWLKPGGCDSDIQKILEEANTFMMAYTEGALWKGRGNPVGKIFVAKHNHNEFADQPQVIVTGKLETLTEKELLEKAARLPGFNPKLLEGVDDNL